MLLVSIEIKDEKPMAFKGRDDIEYVLCQSCMVKWFRVLGIEVDIPVPVGQQRLVIKEVSGHNLN